jgi:hypothetical protein
MDMAIACMLTNHHLEVTEPHCEDHDMLLRLRIMRKRKKQLKDAARKKSVRASKRKRKRQAQLDLDIADNERTQAPVEKPCVLMALCGSQTLSSIRNKLDT